MVEFEVSRWLMMLAVVSHSSRDSPSARLPQGDVSSRILVIV